MADLTADNGDLLTSDTGDQLVDALILVADAATFAVAIGSAVLSWSGETDGALVTDDGVTVLTADNGDTLVVDAPEGTLTDDDGVWLTADNGDVLVVPETSGQNYVTYPDTGVYTLTGQAVIIYDRLFVRNIVAAGFNWAAAYEADLAAAHLLTTETTSFALTGYQMAPVTSAARMGADSAQFAVSSVGAGLIGTFNIVQASPATFTMTGEAVSFRAGHAMWADAGTYVLDGKALTRIRYYKIEAWPSHIALTPSSTAFLYRPVNTKAGGDDAPTYSEVFRTKRWREQAKDRDRLKALLEGREYVDPDEVVENARKPFQPTPLPPEVIPPVRPLQINPARLQAALQPFIQQRQRELIAQQNRAAAEMLLF